MAIALCSNHLYLVRLKSRVLSILNFSWLKISSFTTTYCRISGVFKTIAEVSISIFRVLSMKASNNKKHLTLMMQSMSSWGIVQTKKRRLLSATLKVVLVNIKSSILAQDNGNQKSRSFTKTIEKNIQISLNAGALKKTKWLKFKISKSYRNA